MARTFVGLSVSDIDEEESLFGEDPVFGEDFAVDHRGIDLVLEDVFLFVVGISFDVVFFDGDVSPSDSANDGEGDGC